MEENEYRDIYHQVNEQRCVFEKSILSRQTMCQYAHRFCLADREGVSCLSPETHLQCRAVLEQIRKNATFALRLTRIDGPLPHAKEIKVQTGGLMGLASLLDKQVPQKIENIQALILSAIDSYGNITDLPYDEISRYIVSYEARQRGRGQKKN